MVIGHVQGVDNEREPFHIQHDALDMEGLR